MAQTKLYLRIKIKTEWALYNLEMKPGDNLIFGRSPDANIPVPKESVSQEHLKISWNGLEVLVEDLNSSNGTYRVPENAKFQQTSFSPRMEALALSLAGSPLELSWSAVQLAGTAVQELTRTEILKEEPKIVDRTQQTAVIEKPKKKQRAHISLENRDGLWWLWALNGLTACLFIFYSFVWENRVLVFASREILKRGAASDILILWAKWVTHHSVALVVFFAILPLLIQFGGHLLINPVRKKIPRSPLAIKIAGSSTFALAILFLPFWGVANGSTLRNFFDAFKILNMKKSGAHWTAEEWVFRLGYYSPAFGGSSFLYKELLLARRNRVLRDCQGVGTGAPWKDKKTCLILLAAVGIETYQEIAPALIADVAARITILQVLDGISRVSQVEGTQAAEMPFFLAALDTVGLAQEGNDILDIIHKASFSEQEKVEVLNELRRRIEIKIQDRFIELKIPRIFWINLPGPLESGI